MVFRRRSRPRPLEGLDKALCWSTPEMIAQEKIRRAQNRRNWVKAGVPENEIREAFGE
jgi:hypothetical protein